MTIVTASQLSLHYGDLEVFTNLDLQVDEGARIGVVGPNGGGKTSLIRILVGELQPSGGVVTWSKGIQIGYVPQNPSQATSSTLRDEIMLAFKRLRRLEDDFASSALEIQMSEGNERRKAERRYASLLEEYEALGGYEYQHRMERVTDGVGLSQETLDTPIESASGGERTRAALARALLSDPDFLILDEPTNYLDFNGLAWLEDFLGQFPRSRGLMVVSHDRYFLDKVVTQIWELDRGRLQVFPGNYSRFQVLKAEQVKRQWREYERQQEYIARETSFIQRYHAGQRSREARGRATRLARMERIEKPEENEPISLSSVDASRTGLVALSTHELKVGYEEDGQRVQLLSMPDVSLQRGSRTAIVGGNGTGKTTLLRTILGEVSPIAGTVNLGHNVEPGYYTQGNVDLPDQSTVLDALLDARHVSVSEARNYLARFLFRGDDVFEPVKSLSGGERSRLALARLLITEPNVLILDEPTTHLDIPSREALEQALLTYAGTLLFVSHDRRLISLLASQLWIVEDGEVHPFPGGFDEWMRSKQVKSDQPEGNSRSPTKSRKSAARKRPPAAGQQTRKAPDYEQVISELESRLQGLERQLEAASKRQDIDEVSRLGQEYDEVQARLEQAWQEWGE